MAAGLKTWHEVQGTRRTTPVIRDICLRTPLSPWTVISLGIFYGPYSGVYALWAQVSRLRLGLQYTVMFHYARILNLGPRRSRSVVITRPS